MKWRTEVPKECGWYWVKLEAFVEVLLLEDGKIKMVGCEGVFPSGDVYLWGDKLEIPE